MKNINFEEVSILLHLSQINEYRVNVYENLKIKISNPNLKRHFQKQINDSNRILENINPFIQSNLEETDLVENNQPTKLDQSQFYFGIACTTTNIRTILISCKFGNECIIKTYQKFIENIEDSSLNCVKLMILKQLKNIKKTYLYPNTFEDYLLFR